MANKYISLLNIKNEAYNLKDTGARSLVNNLHMTVDKANYKNYVGISSSSEYYNKVIFINDNGIGCGIIYLGKLYINSPYWIEVVDTMPTEDDLAADTIYFVKE